MVPSLDDHTRRLSLGAALLFLLGALTGIPLALAQTGVLTGDAHTVLGAHMNAILGCFLLLGVSYTLRLTRLGQRGLSALVLFTLIPTYANWLVTLVKAFLHVRGVSFTGEPANDGVAVALNVLVVFPTLAGAALWCWGLRGGAQAVPVGVPSGSGTPSRRAT
ncbi:MAG: hypothetical protein IPG45_29255 [Deltaproteobacteria bacterium]|jgi:hydroxylaminobenzene mutase|nr:hypothetical protein [Deltaproteobacteria bacterium]